MGAVTIIIIIAVVVIFYFFCCYKKQKRVSGRNIQESGASSGLKPRPDFQGNTATAESSKYLTPTMTRGRSVQIGPV